MEEHPEPRLGLLAQPSLLERLRQSWSLEALLPSPDPGALKTREWRAAAALTIATHALLVAAIIFIGWLAVVHVVAPPKEIVRLVDVNDIPRKDESKPTPESGGGQSTPGGASGASNPGGSGGVPKAPPPSPGVLPPSSPKPPIVPPSLKTMADPSLAIQPTVVGPELTQPVPGQIGMPDLPPAPDVPFSPGDGKGGGIGGGEGPGAGRGVGDGGGNGRDPGGVPGGPGRGGDSTTGDIPGQSGSTIGGGLANRPARLVRPVAARPTAAMIENGTSGTVRFYVVIGTDGQIQSATPLSTLPNGATEAARQALYNCKFLPALKDGVPIVSERLLVKIEFRNL